MNPYRIVTSGNATPEAAALQARLMAWHDAMVAHERRLRTGQTSDVCDDECPHVDARMLWAEATGMLGSRADELTFLRSRALGSSVAPTGVVATAAMSEEAESVHRSRLTRELSTRSRLHPRPNPSDRSRVATAEM